MATTQARGAPRTPSRSARLEDKTGSELMFTWEVLHSIYPTHTFHMEDNPAYSDIIDTRNVLAKVCGVTAADDVTNNY